MGRGILTELFVQDNYDYIHGIPDGLYHISEIQGILIPLVKKNVLKHFKGLGTTEKVKKQVE